MNEKKDISFTIEELQELEGRCLEMISVLPDNYWKTLYKKMAFDFDHLIAMIKRTNGTEVKPK